MNFIESEHGGQAKSTTSDREFDVYTWVNAVDVRMKAQEWNKGLKS